MRDLSALYRAWCDLDLASLPACADAVENSQADAEAFGQLGADAARRVREQLGFVRTLARGEHPPILLCYYLLGLHYKEVRRHDFAALLFYRTIEGCLTKHLEFSHPGFRCDDPDYSRIRGFTPEELLARYNEAAALLGDEHKEQALPRRLGYMNSAGLLYALQDRLFRQPSCPIKTPDDLRHLYKLARLRNQSVLAHGFQSVKADECKELQARALGILRAFWNIHMSGADVDRACAALQFIRVDS